MEINVVVGRGKSFRVPHVDPRDEVLRGEPVVDFIGIQIAVHIPAPFLLYYVQQLNGQGYLPRIVGPIHYWCQGTEIVGHILQLGLHCIQKIVVIPIRAEGSIPTFPSLDGMLPHKEWTFLLPVGPALFVHFF